MEMMINEKFLVDDVDFIQEEISRLSGVEVLADRMKKFCEEQENTIFYFDENLKMVDDKNCKYSWIDSGFRVSAQFRGRYKIEILASIKTLGKQAFYSIYLHSS